MSVRKFIAPTSREALREVRQALGDDAVVLASRSVENGVEITAVAQEALAQLAPPAHADGPQAARPRSMGGRSARSPAAGVGVARQAPQASLGVPEQDPCNDAWGRHLMSEIHALRGALEGQIAGLAWTEHQRRDPQGVQCHRPPRALRTADARGGESSGGLSRSWMPRSISRLRSSSDGLTALTGTQPDSAPHTPLKIRG